ncbi:MAG: lipid A biosynthesis lauroyl acyltransferase, partial [Pseudolabrys sp.]
AGTMQIITSVIEGWIREHPEQWLWMHRRWRPEEPQPANGRF